MYGLNLEISTFVDATNSIVQGAHLFDDLVGYLMTQKSINTEIFSYRSGSKQRIVQGNEQLAKLYAELDGYKDGQFSPYVGGMKQKIAKAVKTVKEGFQNPQSLAIGF